MDVKDVQISIGEPGAIEKSGNKKSSLSALAGQAGRKQEGNEERPQRSRDKKQSTEKVFGFTAKQQDANQDCG